MIFLEGWDNEVNGDHLKWIGQHDTWQQQSDKSATTTVTETLDDTTVQWMTCDSGLAVSWVWGWGLNSSSGITKEGHHSRLMLATTTTTTTLFLPESRARMRDRGQENKEKNKIEEWKAKHSEDI